MFFIERSPGNVNRPTTCITFEHELMMSSVVRILSCHVVLNIPCQLLLSMQLGNVRVNFSKNWISNAVK
jgi:hypothetical protein